MSNVRIVHNKLLGGWFVVRGAHQTPISGRFDSRAEAKASLKARERRASLKSERQAQADAIAMSECLTVHTNTRAEDIALSRKLFG